MRSRLSVMLKNLSFMARLIWERHRVIFPILAVDAACGVAIPFIGIYLPRIALRLIEEGVGAGELITRLGAFILVMAAVYFAGRFASSSRYWHINTIRSTLGIDLFLKSLEVDYSYLESPAGQDHYNRAQQSLSRGDGCATSRLVNAVPGFVVGLAGFALYGGILMTLHPLIVVFLFTTSIVTYFTIRRATRYGYSVKSEAASIEKKIMYIKQLTEKDEPAKDIRMYGMRKIFADLKDELFAALICLESKTQGKWYTVRLADAIIVLARDGLAYAYLIYMITNGRMPVSDFVFYFGAIAGFSGWLSNILNQAGIISGAQMEVSDIRTYLALDSEDSAARPAGGLSDRKITGAPSITFENVSFSYGDGKPVLRNFSFEIRGGEKIALVGVNGAGKTTLIKLLCGFYRPGEGRILIDGTDIEDMERAELYALFSAVFQDIMILPYTLAENVALKGRDKIDRERAESCLALAGLEEDVRALPSGMDTQMQRIVSSAGVSLSGGQQQKLLLARALYKDAPILVLDEPTAALDPIAESALYDKYDSLSRGKTSLYISHRLASTRFCDRIVYLNDGVAEEIGTHEQLMRMGGGYASMYEVQSHYYKDNIGEAI